MRRFLAALVLVGMAAPTGAAERDLMLVCKGPGVVGSIHYLLQFSSGEARIVSFDPPRVGKLEARENTYILRFPATKTHWEQWVRINRYTGAADAEIGSSPFFPGKSGNWSGSHTVCEKVKPDRKF